MKKIIICLFAAICIAAGCQREIDIDSPGYGNTFTVSINAVKGDGGTTRALAVEGTALNAIWTAGDVVNVAKNGTNIGTLTAKTDGVETALEGTLAGPFSTTDILTLSYLSPDYTGQDGTLEYIAAHCDYAIAQVSISSVSGGELVTSPAVFENQQSITSISFTDGTNSLQPTSVTISSASGKLVQKYQSGSALYGDLTVTPGSACFVAMRNESGASDTYTFTATVGSDTYTGTKSATLENGNYYSTTVTLSKDYTYVGDLVDPALTSMWKYTDSGQDTNVSSISLDRLLNSSYCQYNFLDLQNLSSAEIAANDYSNASLVKIVHQSSSNDKTGVPIPIKINEMLSASQVSSLRESISSAETVSGEYDDNVRDAILNWWIENGLEIYYQQVIDAYRVAFCVRSLGSNYGCDMGIYNYAGVQYNVDDYGLESILPTGAQQIGYNTRIRFTYKQSSSQSPFYNDANTDVYLVSWKSIAIILYNTYYLKNVLSADVPVSEVTLDRSALSLINGTNAPLVATVGPVNATMQEVTWSSSNPSVATVSEEGVVSGIQEGYATITAECGGVSASCVVDVYDPLRSDYNPGTYLIYRANTVTSTASGFLSIDSYMPALSGAKVELKFQLAAPSLLTSSNTSREYYSYIAIRESQLEWNSPYKDEDGESWDDIESWTIPSATSLLWITFDGINGTMTINGSVSAYTARSVMSFPRLFASYYRESDTGIYETYGGIADGSKLYYARAWDADGTLNQFAYATTAVNPDTNQTEYCWCSYYPKTGDVNYTFANDAVNQGGFEGYTYE